MKFKLSNSAHPAIYNYLYCFLHATPGTANLYFRPTYEFQDGGLLRKKRKYGDLENTLNML